MRLGRLLLGGSVAVALAAAAAQGCGGGSSEANGNVCISPPACVGGRTPSSSEQQACLTALGDVACGAQYRAMKECQTYRSVCSASGSFDSSATNTQCANEITAYNTCKQSTTDAGCRPRSCAQRAANCGEVDDGCGGRLQCGTCTNGQTCGANNRCSCTCDPTWCGTLTACGQTLTCPTTCAAPQFCGGGGVANRCGCSPSGTVGPQTSTSVTTATISLEAGSPTSWSNATGARAPDTSYASATMTVGRTTNFLVALSYGFQIPQTAKIDGITVQVERLATSGLATTDFAVHLVKNTQIQSSADNKALTNLIWPQAEGTATYGGPADTWGTTWTPAEINAGGFGVALAATYTGQTGSESARVDAITVTVTYSGANCN